MSEIPCSCPSEPLGRFASIPCFPATLGCVFPTDPRERECCWACTHPGDSRVVGWINSNLSVKVEYLRLADEGYYNGVMDYVQEVCRAADVLPCVWDAAAFDDEDTLSTQYGQGNGICKGKNA